MQLLDFSQYLVTTMGVQTGRRFIQDDYRRLHSNHPGHRHTPLLPAGKLKRGPVTQGLKIQPYHFHSLLHSSINLIVGQADVTWPECYIFENSLFKKLVFRVLKYKADLLSYCLEMHAFSPNIHLINKDPATRGFQQAVEVLNQSRFSRTGLSDNRYEFPVLYLKGHVVDSAPLKRSAGIVCVTQVLYPDRHSILLTPHMKLQRFLYRILTAHQPTPPLSAHPLESSLRTYLTHAPVV